MTISDHAAAGLPAADLDAAYATVAETVRERDHDRWVAGLWAPAEHRRHLYALYAFSGEIARIRDVVSDPLPGEVRARWWADVLTGCRGGEGHGHPVAACVIDTMRRFDLPAASFERLIEARIFDLYDDPMTSLAELDTYCDDTVGVLLDLGRRVLDGPFEDEAASAVTAAGRAYGLTGILRALPFHASRGQSFLPADVLAARGVTREDVVSGRSTPGLLAALADLRAHARAALAETRRRIGLVSHAATPAFLPVALVEAWLDRMDRPDYDPFHTSVELSPWTSLWRLWRAARRARRSAMRRGELV